MRLLPENGLWGGRSTGKKIIQARAFPRFEKDIFPWLGTRSVDKIVSPVLLTAIRRIESRGSREAAHRPLSNCKQIFCYAIATGRAQRDPTSGLRGALSPVKERRTRNQFLVRRS